MTDKSSKIKENLLLFMLKEVTDNVNALFFTVFYEALYKFQFPITKCRVSCHLVCESFLLDFLVSYLF